MKVSTIAMAIKPQTNMLTSPLTLAPRTPLTLARREHWEHWEHWAALEARTHRLAIKPRRSRKTKTATLTTLSTATPATQQHWQQHQCQSLSLTSACHLPHSLTWWPLDASDNHINWISPATFPLYCRVPDINAAHPCTPPDTYCVWRFVWRKLSMYFSYHSAWRGQ